jgi:stage III sporulation protein AD
MMDFYAVFGFGLLVTILLVILRKERPEIAVLLALVAAALILGGLLQKISEVLLVFETLAIKADLNRDYLKLTVKIVGFAYLAGFGVQICKDAGEHSIAAKLELAGKIFILGLGLPVMAGLLNLILSVFKWGP